MNLSPFPDASSVWLKGAVNPKCSYVRVWEGQRLQRSAMLQDLGSRTPPEAHPEGVHVADKLLQIGQFVSLHVFPRNNGHRLQNPKLEHLPILFGSLNICKPLKTPTTFPTTSQTLRKPLNPNKANTSASNTHQHQPQIGGWSQESAEWPAPSFLCRGGEGSLSGAQGVKQI